MIRRPAAGSAMHEYRLVKLWLLLLTGWSCNAAGPLAARPEQGGGSAPSPAIPAAAPALGHPAQALGQPRQAFWLVGDDRDNPPIRKLMGVELACRMRDASVREPVLLHAGDAYNHGWFRANTARQAEVLEGWEPLRQIAGIRFLLAPGNHEGVAGSVELGRLLGEEAGPFRSLPSGPLRYIMLNTEDRDLRTTGTGTQADWLRAELQEARRMRSLPVLVMHRPPSRMACGGHQHDRDLVRWDEVLQLLLAPVEAGLLVAAHDHLYARFQPFPGWTGLIVGHGGAPLYRLRPCPGVIRALAPSSEEVAALDRGVLDPRRFHGFVECQVQGKQLDCTAVRLDREVHDRFSIPLPTFDVDAP